LDEFHKSSDNEIYLDKDQYNILSSRKKQLYFYNLIRRGIRVKIGANLIIFNIRNTSIRGDDNDRLNTINEKSEDWENTVTNFKGKRIGNKIIKDIIINSDDLDDTDPIFNESSKNLKEIFELARENKFIVPQFSNNDMISEFQPHNTLYPRVSFMEKRKQELIDKLNLRNE
jgi:hypothetical protein